MLSSLSRRQFPPGCQSATRHWRFPLDTQNSGKLGIFPPAHREKRKTAEQPWTGWPQFHRGPEEGARGRSPADRWEAEPGGGGASGTALPVPAPGGAARAAGAAAPVSVSASVGRATLGSSAPSSRGPTATSRSCCEFESCRVRLPRRWGSWRRAREPAQAGRGDSNGGASDASSRGPGARGDALPVVFLSAVGNQPARPPRRGRRGRVTSYRWISRRVTSGLARGAGRGAGWPSPPFPGRARPARRPVPLRLIPDSFCSLGSERLPALAPLGPDSLPYSLIAKERERKAERFL